MPLEGKVALITGGSSGIGEASAMLLAKQQAKVAVVGRSAEKLEDTVSQIKKEGGTACYFTADISQAGEIETTIRKVLEKWNRLDIVFANAGINGVWAPLEELTPEDWDTTMNINLRGTFLTVKYAAPALKKRGGSVIITSSVNGTRIFSNTGATAYACTKAAQVAFAKMTALELAKHGIRVNVVCPGAIETKIEEKMEERDIEQEKEQVEFPEGKIPLSRGKPGTSEQVAQLVLFLASDASSHITGTEIWIDGGQSLLQG